MSRPVVALTAILAMIAVGCGTPILPAAAVTIDIDRGVDPPATMPVTIMDPQAMLVAVDAFPLRGDDAFVRDVEVKLRPETVTLVTLPNDPNKVIAFWLGGGCDDRATIALSNEAGTVLLEMTVDASCVDGTFWMHAVALDFRVVVPADAVKRLFRRDLHAASAT